MGLRDLALSTVDLRDDSRPARQSKQELISTEQAHLVSVVPHFYPAKLEKPFKSNQGSVTNLKTVDHRRALGLALVWDHTCWNSKRLAGG